MAYFAHGTHSMASSHRAQHQPTPTERLARMEKLATWLDARWKIPGTSFHVGLDGVLGLLPGIGDTLTAALASWIVYESHQLGAPWWLKMRMGWNVLVDWLVGTIPLVGDVFDIGWKANEKNVKLLMAYLSHTGKKHTHI